MDTSKEYIEMCERATEIQERKLHTPAIVFVQKWVNKIYNPIYTLHYGNREWDHCEEEKSKWKDKTRQVDKIIWLPRQDELQDLIVKETGVEATPINWLKEILYRLTRIYKFNVLDRLDISPEILWLLFYMHSLHRKVWNFEIKTWEEKNDNPGFIKFGDHLLLTK